MGSDDKSLVRAGTRGGTFAILAQAVRFILRMVSLAVFARLLTPSDFGLVAIVASIVGFITAIRDLGFSAAIIQKEQISDAELNQIFAITVVFTLGAAILSALSSPYVALIFEDDRLAAILLVMSLIVVMEGLSAQPAAILRRGLRFGLVAKIEVGAMLLGFLCSVIAALHFKNYWALVTAPAATSFFSMCGLWAFGGWKPGRIQRRIPMSHYLRFGGWLSGTNLLNYLFRNMDNLVVGKVSGASALGYYANAYGLLMLPLAQINAPLTTVAIPILSRLQNEPVRFSKYLFRAISIVAFFGFPVVFLLAASATEIIAVVMGRNWDAVVPIFYALMPAAVVGVVNVITGWVYISTGRVRRHFWTSLMNAAACLVAFFYGSRWGAVGVATSLSVVLTLLHVPGILICFQGTSLELSKYVRAVTRPCLFAATAGFVAFMAAERVAPLGGAVWALLAAGAAMSVCYLGLWVSTASGRQFLNDLVSYVRTGASVP